MAERIFMKNDLEKPFFRANETDDLRESIRSRAEEIYIRSGRIPGRDLENWSQAEKEIRRELEKPARRRAILVRIQGVNYIGEYHAETSDAYMPGEFQHGEFIRIRIAGNRMFVRRPNGKELETRIVKTLPSRL